MNILRFLIAIGIGTVIWTASMAVIRAVANPPPEIDPDDVVETRQRFRCSLCGTEVTMTMTNTTASGPPRHCREEMDEAPID